MSDPTETPESPEAPPGPTDEPTPATVAFVTTEHFNLATARASTIGEANGRASLFLGSVSAGLVAFAFAGQVSRTALYTFGLVLFPVLFFLGLTTFSRTLQSSIADTIYMLRINRLRRYYFDHAPHLAEYMVRPAPTDDLLRLLREEGYRVQAGQTFLSVPGSIGVVNGVLLGVIAGLATAALSGDNLWVGTLTGLVVLVLTVMAHQRYQMHARRQKPDPFGPDREPS